MLLVEIAEAAFVAPVVDDDADDETDETPVCEFEWAPDVCELAAAAATTAAAAWC